MSRKTKPPQEPAAPTTEALIPWDQELASAATEAAANQSGGGGKFFSLKAGVLALAGQVMDNNEMAVIVVAECFDQAYYEGAYDEGNSSGPKCFALGTKEDELRPHKVCVDAGTAQAESCGVCPFNGWGSSERGKGKACGHKKRLAIIPAGRILRDGRLELDDPETMAEAEAAFLRVPVMSVKNWAGYVRQLDATLHRPPYAVVTKIKSVPDTKSQFKLLFSTLQPLDVAYRSVVTDLHKKLEALIEFPYGAWKEPKEGAEPKRGNFPQQKAPATPGKY